jgi:hypothetical protein
MLDLDNFERQQFGPSSPCSSEQTFPSRQSGCSPIRGFRFGGMLKL